MQSTRIIISLLIVLTLLVAPMHALMAAGKGTGGVEHSLSDAHAGHGSHVAVPGDCTGSASDAEHCLDCVTCTPLLPSASSLGHSPAAAGPEYIPPLPKAYQPARELRPPRTRLV
jgi:hypothetical protein